MPRSVAEAFIFSSEDGSTTRFWLADPAKPSVRRLLQTAGHQQGWAGSAAVSPDGGSIAYTLLPVGARDPDHDAQLFVLSVATGESRALAHGIDLRSTLVWALNSGSVIYESLDGTQQQIWSESIEGGQSRLLLTAAPQQRLLPIAYEPGDRDLLIAQFDSDGVELEALTQGVAPQHLAHLSNGSARDFALGSDGSQLAYLATEPNSGDSTSRAYLANSSNGTRVELPASWGEIAGIAWNPDGMLAVGSTGKDAALRTQDGAALRAPVPPGFAQPLQWSPSGRYLAVRLFTGESADQPGTARDALLTTDGQPLAIADSLPVRFVGWVPEDAQHGSR